MLSTSTYLYNNYTLIINKQFIKQKNYPTDTASKLQFTKSTNHQSNER